MILLYITSSRRYVWTSSLMGAHEFSKESTLLFMAIFRSNLILGALATKTENSLFLDPLL